MIVIIDINAIYTIGESFYNFIKLIQIMTQQYCPHIGDKNYSELILTIITPPHISFT